MKKTKIIIPALGLLLLSTAASVTGTVAWFAANASVSATGMQVKAKTASTYLLIGTGDNDTAAEIQAISPASTSVALTVSDEQALVLPSKPVENSTEAGYLSVATGHKNTAGTDIATAGVIVDDGTKAAAFTNWYTAAAAAPTASAMADGTAKQLAGFDGYVIQRTAYLTVAVGATSAHNLTVTPTFTQLSGGTDINAVKMIIATSDGGFAKLSSAQNSTAVDIKGSNTAITPTSLVTVNMYLYYDGSETNVYTTNLANLTGASISLEFGVTEA